MKNSHLARFCSFKLSALVAFAASLLLWQSAQAALLIDEPFNYPLGNLGTQGGWAQSGSQPELVVTNGNLSVSGLLASTGNKVTFTGTGRVCYKGFAGPASGTIYFSFILRVNATPTAATLFASLQSASTSKRLCVHLGTDNRLGLSYNAGTVTYGGSALTAGTDYLVVGSLEIVDGSANDIFRLWVNPASSTFGATEPAADAQMTSGADTTYTSARFYFQRDAGNAGLDADELRVGVSWAEVTPSGVCDSPTITASPTNQTVAVGTAATFAITATGSTPTYQWQISADNGASWNNVSGGSGATTPSYTTPVLGMPENGSQYRCIEYVACTNQYATSGVAIVSIVDLSGNSFRSVTSGNWNSPATWETSTDNVNWSPAAATPSAGVGSIAVRADHIVTVTAPIDADQLVVEATGEIDASGATFTINDGAAPIDADVSGVLKVANVAGSAITANGQLKFENGSKFTCALSTATAIPTATWAANSTCEIAPAAAGAFVPGGLSQSFGNFVWNWPAQSASVILGGALTNVQGDFEITPGTAAAAGFCFGKKPDALTDVLTVTIGGAIKVHPGGGNFLLGTGGTETGTYLTKVGKGIIVDAGGRLDFGNPQATSGNLTVQFTGNGEYTLNGVAPGNPFAPSFIVDNGATLTLNSPLSVGSTNRTFIVNGTLNFNTNIITLNGSLTNNGTLIGSGTNALTTGTGNIAYGGTLNLPGLPTFVGGESFQLFGAGAYSGTFTSIVPFAPGAGLSWDTTQLTTSGTLAVATGGSGGGPIRITSTKRFGSYIVLTIDGGAGNANTNFSVLTATNVALPVSNWDVQATGLTLDGVGVAFYTNAISGPRLFYDIRVP